MDRDDFVDGLLESVREILITIEEYELLDEDFSVVRDIAQQLYDEIESLI